jgi:hypothetical protein
MLPSQRMQQLRHAGVGLKLRFEGIKDIPGVEDDSPHAIGVMIVESTSS